jgi:hypothetical protein
MGLSCLRASIGEERGGGKDAGVSPKNRHSGAIEAKTAEPSQICRETRGGERYFCQNPAKWMMTL